MPRLFEHLDELSVHASYFFQRSKVIQSNIANVDTPFYRPKDLVFEKELRKEFELKRTDPRHIDPSKKRSPFKEVELNEYSGYDGNRVNMDKELAKLAETAIMVKTLNEVIRKEIGKLKLSITGR